MVDTFLMYICIVRYKQIRKEGKRMATTYQQIEGEVNDMMAEQAVTGNHVNRIIAGYSVNLYRASKEFAIGCGMFHTESGMRAAEWLHANSK